MGCFPKQGVHSSTNTTAVQGESTSPSIFAERHYTVAEIAEMWNLSPDAVRGLFKNEPGVLIFKDTGYGAMLTIYRRHRKECAHRSEGRTYRRCRCPIWADGFLGAAEIRRSTGLRDWEKAQELVRQWEAEGKSIPVQQCEPLSIHQACEHFLEDAIARKLREKTVYKYRLLFRRLEEFVQANGLRFLKEMDLVTLRKFRASWSDGNLAALKKLERLRSFFRFAQSSKWIEDNPTPRFRGQSP